MQTETPNQQAIPARSKPEIGPAGDSTSGKKQHGGKRPGAGRKPNLVKRLIGPSPLSACQILEGIDVEGTIAEIMKKGSLSLKQRTLGASRTPCQMPRKISQNQTERFWMPGWF